MTARNIEIVLGGPVDAVRYRGPRERLHIQRREGNPLA
jgi:hypothetical protein